MKYVRMVWLAGLLWALTAPVSDVCDPFTAPFPYLFVTTTATTGTGASGTGKIGY